MLRIEPFTPHYSTHVSSAPGRLSPGDAVPGDLDGDGLNQLTGDGHLVVGQLYTAVYLQPPHQPLRLPRPDRRLRSEAYRTDREGRSGGGTSVGDTGAFLGLFSDALLALLALLRERGCYDSQVAANWSSDGITTHSYTRSIDEFAMHSRKAPMMSASGKARSALLEFTE